MRDDQVVLDVDSDLHVVADDAGATTARRHRAAVGIGERDLLVGRGQHALLVRRELLHLVLERGQLLLEVHRLDRQRQRRRLVIGGVELRQIAGDTLLDLLAAPLDLALGEVAVAIVDGFEFAPIDGHARRRQQPHLAAQIDEARADLLDRRPVVLAEVGDHLVVRRQAPEQPDHFEVAPRLALQPTARLHAIEIASRCRA